MVVQCSSYLVIDLAVVEAIHHQNFCRFIYFLVNLFPCAVVGDGSSYVDADGRVNIASSALTLTVHTVT